MPSIVKVVKGVYQSEAARRQPVGVTRRLLVWQLWRRISRRPMRFTTVTGTRLILLPGASDSLSGFWYHQIPDFEELTFMLHVVRKGELFVDVGANQGGWSVTVAGLGARVISFEPVPVTRDRLLANVNINGSSITTRIQVHPFGLGESNRQVTFTADMDATNHEMQEGELPTGKTITVDLKTGDGILENENPVAIKIDVEGGELGVLKGARKILERSSLLAIVMETFRPHNYLSPQLIESESILRTHGFDPMAYCPKRRLLSALVGPADGSQNTIYVRNKDEVKARLSRAPLLNFCGTQL